LTLTKVKTSCNMKTEVVLFRVHVLGILKTFRNGNDQLSYIAIYSHALMWNLVYPW
jgi:hypothetical protein